MLPTASSIAGHVKFSEAMSSISPRCRSSSRSSSAATSGSTSARPAVRSCLERHRRRRPSRGMLLRVAGRRASAAETAPSRSTRGSGPGQVEHRRRCSRELAHVQDRGDAVEDLLRDVADSPRIRSAVQVRARRGDHADAREELGGKTADFRDADADRVRPPAGEPRETTRRVREDERERRRATRSPTRSSGISSTERVDAGRDERDGLLGRPPLERRQRAHGLLSIRPCRRARRPCRSG